jgi:EAL domain-containing protein (putative c-di-GMP-specific phosphodiesterase class I)
MPKYLLFAFSLRDPLQLSSILGESVVEEAWTQISLKMNTKLTELFFRYNKISNLETDGYQCFSTVLVGSSDILFDEDEQVVVLTSAAHRLVYETMVEYFGGGSGRKIDFMILIKPINELSSVKKGMVSQWMMNEGISSSEFFKAFTTEHSQLYNVTKSGLTNIINDEKLQTYLQSIVRLEDAKVMGYEVLTRGPKGSDIERPDKLFGSASHFGLSKEVEFACIKQAMKYLPLLPKELFLSFNVGPDLLVSDELEKLLISENVVNYHKNIAFELTEHLPLNDVEKVKSTVNNLQLRGIKVLLDDTGCGFFDLGTAESLRPSVVKLCISVIRRIDNSSGVKREIEDTRKKLSLIGCITLGEGVETHLQVNILKEAGVQFAQGFLFDKPKPILQVLDQFPI